MIDDLWYLSFVDTSAPYEEENDYPGGPRWLGACVVPGFGEVDAVSNAHLMGCNPGGQVSIFGPIPPEKVKPEYVGVLLDRATVEEAGI